jgi:hypothetical protein
MTRRDLLTIGLLLLALGVALHVLHVVIFRSLHDTLFYLLLDIAFLPLNVLFITLIVEQLLSRRERQTRRHKMNMVIGAFYSAVGQRLIGLMSPLVANRETLSAGLALGPSSTEADIRRAEAVVEATKIEMAGESRELTEIRSFLAEQRAFMLGLLENPTLLEHERFTDLLWAVFHLQEELSARRALEALLGPDRAHIAVDFDRAYSALLIQWLEYLQHLKRDYPYLFSFAARTNPWRADACAEVE